MYSWQTWLWLHRKDYNHLQRGCFLEKSQHVRLRSPYKLCPVTGTSGKGPTCQCRRRKDTGSNPGSQGFPWKKAWQPTPVFVPEESHRPGSLAGYSPWGRKESDTTEVIYQVPPLYLFILRLITLQYCIGFAIH